MVSTKPFFSVAPGGLPSGVNCVFSPSAVSLNGTSNSTSTLTVTTTARTATAKSPPGAPRRFPPGTLPLALLGLLGLLLAVRRLAIGNRHSAIENRRRRLRPALALFAVLLVASLSPGCDYTFPNLISPAPGTGTPAGNYQITVYGTLSGATTISRGAVVNLGVS